MDKSNNKTPRPAFQSVQKFTASKNPEEVFARLSGRAGSHAYLRGPQQDVLREYSEKCSNAQDVAAELPTGTGKTTVGLIIAEAQRQAGKRVAYLSLTNQLAGQVLDEAKRLNLPCADLRGDKATRMSSEEGRFKTCGAVGVSTYSNLFNVNPVINECDLLVFDDAHGAEQNVADMWTVTVRRYKDGPLFEALLADLAPGMMQSQLRAILDGAGFRTIDMADTHGHPETLLSVSATLDKVSAAHIRFPWSLIRNKLSACLFLVSVSEITIRPLIPPTDTHEPFARVAQRIYMSATLGGESDLLRAYGIERATVVRAKSQQWGRRYVFVPGMFLKSEETHELIATVWEGISPQRAVLLAPSERVMDRTYTALTSAIPTAITRFGSVDIENSIENFVKRDGAILTLAGRYDGLDLPGDQCRLLIMAESPAATNPLEHHLSERWKLGPVLRKRERTRLIQGMGRCTRSATDYAVIIWLGQSLVNAATSQPLLAGMPAELATEIRWGLKQVESTTLVGDIASMITGLLSESDYRKSADDSITEATGSDPVEGPPLEYEKAGSGEVRFAKAMWEEDHTRALSTARSIADQITAPELAGYRAWWLYLASIAAGLAKNRSAESDALQRASHCGVNRGWISSVLLQRTSGIVNEAGIDEFESNAEGIWDLLDSWGWAGPNFARRLEKMQEQLSNQYHVSYHEGLETLGKCLGADTIRSTEDGAPDVIWSFARDIHFPFEAKTEKIPSSSLTKKNLLETKGHVDWVLERVVENSLSASIDPILVSPHSNVHSVGDTFRKRIFYIHPDKILEFSRDVAKHLLELRVKFGGRDYPAAAKELSVEIRAANMDVPKIISMLKETPL